MFKLNHVLRRHFLTALVFGLALAAGGAGQPLPAQAAPLRAGELRYFMQATKVRGTGLICVGDDVAINVQVVRAQVTQGVATNAELITGAAITGAVKDPSIGSLAPAKNWSGWRGQEPGTAYFTFAANKAGSTTIAFEGKIHYHKGILDHFSLAQRNDLVSDTLDVTVQDCAYQVTVTTRWTDPSRKHTALIQQAPLSSDAPGHYIGTTKVSWIVREDHALNGCPLHSVVSTSPADLTATLAQDGESLVVTVVYQPLELVWFTYRSDDCTEGSEIDSRNTAAQLSFSVGAHGGSGTLPQSLTAPGYGIFNSSASISVVRVPKQ